MRFCNKCQEWKDPTEFYKTTNGGCKKCVQAYHKEWKLKKYPPQPKSKLPDGLRRCSKCREIKAVSDFYKSSSNKSGYGHRCKLCDDIMSRARKQKVREVKLALIEPIPEGYKRCSKCNDLLDLSKFQLLHTGSNAGKYKSNCRQCEKKYRQENRNKINLASKLRHKNPEVKERRKVVKRKFYDKLVNDPGRLEKELEYRRQYRKRQEVIAKNRVHNLEYRMRPENQEKARARTIEWHKKNIKLARHQQKIRRGRKLSAEGSYTLEQWIILLSFFDCCPKCKKQNILTCDHIIPLTKGGTNFIDNLQPLCKSCNSAKNNHVIIDYRPRDARQWAHLQINGSCNET